MDALSNLKHEAFCREYCKSRNATDAYRKAGYSAKTADTNAVRLMGNEGIKARIAGLDAEIGKRVMMDAEAVVQRYVDIATADPNELMQNRVGACRYCHGYEHEYQWRTREEFHAAASKWMTIPEQKKTYTNPEPSDDGGFGYRRTLDPHPDCPGCDGFGETYRVLMDTTKLSPQALALYAGVKEGKDGIEIKTHDRQKALDMLARHLGVFEKDNKQKAGGGDVLAQLLLTQINGTGSKAPLNRGDDDA